MTYTCTTCGAKDTQPIPVDPDAHTWDAGKVTTEPTCTKEGEKTYTCTACGATKTGTVEAKGHDWGKWETIREATEDEDGEQERTCEACGATQTRTVGYEGDMPETGVFTVPAGWLVAVLALSLTGYIALKRKAVRG